MEYAHYSYPVESSSISGKFVKLAKGRALFVRISTERAGSQENTFAVRP